MCKVDIQNGLKIKLDCRVIKDGWMTRKLSEYLGISKALPKKASLEFYIKDSNVPELYTIKWKVRNYGKEAELANDLRGEIRDDLGSRTKKNLKIQWWAFC